MLIENRPEGGTSASPGHRPEVAGRGGIRFGQGLAERGTGRGPPPAPQAGARLRVPRVPGKRVSGSTAAGGSATALPEHGLGRLNALIIARSSAVIVRPDRGVEIVPSKRATPGSAIAGRDTRASGPASRRHQRAARQADGRVLLGCRSGVARISPPDIAARRLDWVAAVVVTRSPLRYCEAGSLRLSACKFADPRTCQVPCAHGRGRLQVGRDCDVATGVGLDVPAMDGRGSCSAPAKASRWLRSGGAQRRPGRFGQGPRPIVADLRWLRHDNRRRGGGVGVGAAAVAGAVGGVQVGAMVCAVLPGRRGTAIGGPCGKFRDRRAGGWPCQRQRAESRRSPSRSPRQRPV